VEPQLCPRRRTGGAGGGGSGVRIFVGVESTLKRRMLAMGRWAESWQAHFGREPTLVHESKKECQALSGHILGPCGLLVDMLAFVARSGLLGSFPIIFHFFYLVLFSMHAHMHTFILIGILLD